MSAGEIILGIVGGRIKAGGFGTAETATRALEDLAAVHSEATQMGGDAPASRAWPQYLGDAPTRRDVNLRQACLQEPASFRCDARLPIYGALGSFAPWL